LTFFLPFSTGTKGHRFIFAELNTLRGALHAGRPLSGQERAAYLGGQSETFNTWIENKYMPAHKVGRLWQFKVGEAAAGSGLAGPPRRMKVEQYVSRIQ